MWRSFLRLPKIRALDCKKFLLAVSDYIRKTAETRIKSVEIAVRDMMRLLRCTRKVPSDAGKVGNGMLIIGCMTRCFVSSYWCVIVYICVFDSSSSDDDDDGRRRTCARARLCIRDPHNFFAGTRTLIDLGIFHCC